MESNEITRDCIDPWVNPFVQADGEVWPCCWYHGSVGNANAKPFTELWDDVPVQTLRENLLTGNLPTACTKCPVRGLTTPAKLLARVRALP